MFAFFHATSSALNSGFFDTESIFDPNDTSNTARRRKVSFYSFAEICSSKVTPYLYIAENAAETRAKSSPPLVSVVV